MYFSGSIGALDSGMIELALDPHLNKTGDIWHICIEVSLLFDCLKSSLALVFGLDCFNRFCNSFKNTIPVQLSE